MAVRRPFSPVARALAAATSVLATGCFAGAPQPTPRPTPVPVILVLPGELRTVPAAPDPVVARLRDEVAAFLSDLYSRGFLPPLPPPRPPPPKKDASPAPTPTAIPRPPVGELFTDAARAALPPEVFSVEAGATVGHGTLSFAGFGVVEGDTPTSALLSVDLGASGRVIVGDAVHTPRAERALRVRQTGQLLLVRTPAGWRVAGFELSLAGRREEPGATATPMAAVRYMPRRIA